MNTNTKKILHVLILSLSAFISFHKATAGGLDQVQQMKHSESSNHKWTEYKVRYGEVNRAEALRLKKLYDSTKAKLEQQIESLIRRGYSKTFIEEKKAKARRILKQLADQIRREFPPTKVVVYGKAVKSDIRDAMRRLNEEDLPLGSDVFVYLKDGKLITSSTKPSDYDMPAPQKSTKSRSAGGTRVPEFKSLFEELEWLARQRGK